METLPPLALLLPFYPAEGWTGRRRGEPQVTPLWPRARRQRPGLGMGEARLGGHRSCCAAAERCCAAAGAPLAAAAGTMAAALPPPRHRHRHRHRTGDRERRARKSCPPCGAALNTAPCVRPGRNLVWRRPARAGISAGPPHAKAGGSVPFCAPAHRR